MARPKLLDLCCGEGGAGTGYDLAGFDVTGVDIAPQPRYPFPFHQADAMTFPLDGFDVIHVSPPCQDYSRAMRHLATQARPRLIALLMKRLAGRVWIIENVPGAPIPHQATLDGDYGTELCGTMFDLPIWRHRLFGSSVPLGAPSGCDHRLTPMNPHRQDRPGGHTPERLYRQAMGVSWMTKQGAREAIPPAYTEYIGGQLMLEFPAREPAGRGSGGPAVGGWRER
jgi:hypothetical protein